MHIIDDRLCASAGFPHNISITLPWIPCLERCTPQAPYKQNTRMGGMRRGHMHRQDTPLVPMTHGAYSIQYPRNILLVSTPNSNVNDYSLPAP